MSERSSADPLAEYDAVVAKVDAAVAAALVAAKDAVTCAAGCDSCCVDGLSVVAVEAAAIARYCDDNDVEFVAKGGGHCVFLDVDGRCAVYAARPLLCRTHGLALRTKGHAPRGALRILDDDVGVCALNYAQQQRPRPAEILDATAILGLLTVVDARFRERTGADAARVSLRGLVEGADDGDDAGKGAAEGAAGVDE